MPPGGIDRLRAAAAHPDRVNHHVFAARAIDDVGLARRTLAKARRTAVLAIAQHENHFAAVVLLAKGAHRLLDGAPERRRRIGRDRRRQRSVELARIVAERWADRDFVPEAPDARDVVLQKTSEELGTRRAEQRCVALHAAGHVEHHDETYGLRGVVELSNRLRRSFVANFEVLLLERRGEPTVSIRHGCEHAHGITSAAKNWWLLRLPFRFLGRADDAQGAGNQWRKRETSFHVHDPSFPGLAGRPSFIARKGARSVSDDRQFSLRQVSEVSDLPRAFNAELAVVR